ncbi:MAG: hypothetical protein KC503_15665 [Myxococcales bacterium]|nr:hypothetical protein [Myxococcales bacterium]
MIFVIVTTADAEHTLSDEHHQLRLEYLDDLARRHVLVAAGPFDDQEGAMMLVRARGMEDAVAIARADPLIEAGLERYEVRGWTDVYDPERRLGDLIDFEPPADRSGPLVAPLPDASFELVDVTTDPRYAEFRTRCFAAARIEPDDPTRLGFLGLMKAQRWKKLLLLNDGAMAGQIEIAAPEAAALPIRSEALTVIHCLWVLDAYTGLEAGRHLLSAAAEAFPDSEGLVTIAYNSALGWLPRAFFEGQGFAIVDQLDTGRFAGDEPIAAYLMWRPFSEDAAPPTWNREQLRVGIDFCPAYPWMTGKRLYWGEDYAYRVRLVKEGLRRPELLEQMPVVATRRAEPWTLVEMGLPASDLKQAIARVQSALIAEPTYYAVFYEAGDGDEMIVVYPYREYRVTKDPATWRDALRYGLDKQIPEAELRFSPIPLEKDPGGRALE